MPEFMDLTGQVFGRLTVLPKRERRNQRTYWVCECECGIVKWVWADSLRRGSTRSCGCLNDELIRERKTTHGLSKSTEYNSWCSMKARCLNPKDHKYPTYGGKGIKIQDSWVNDFMEFYNHIGPKPQDGQRYSVDRIDRNGNYEEGNVRWADDKTQSRNTGKPKNNTSGATGVRRMSKPGRRTEGEVASWLARWTDLDGVRRSKNFSVNKYGEELAEFLACEYRDLMILRQNQIEGNYAEDYGK